MAENNKLYTLIGRDGKPFLSPEKGKFGGNRSTKVYGRMDCPAALRALNLDSRDVYIKNRVFFPDEATALAAGFRPCGTCLRERYKQWKAGQLDALLQDPSTSDDKDTIIDNYAPEVRQEIEQVISTFRNYIRSSPHFDILWSDKVGYIYLSMDVTRGTVADSDSWVIKNAEELFDKLAFEIAIDVLEEGGHTIDPREASKLERDAVIQHLKSYTSQLPWLEVRIQSLFEKSNT